MMLLILLAAAWGFDLPKPTDYKIDTYWEYGVGVSNLSSKFSYAATNTITNTSYVVDQIYSSVGPTGEIKHGVTLDEAAFFELGSRLGYLFGANANFYNSTGGSGSLAVRDHMIAELFAGGGYSLTFLPVRWYAHFLMLSFRTNADSDFSPAASGFRVGAGYHVNNKFSVNLEIQNASPTYGNYTYSMSMTNLNFTWNKPFDYPSEPWKKKYQRSDDFDPRDETKLQ